MVYVGATDFCGGGSDGAVLSTDCGQYGERGVVLRQDEILGDCRDGGGVSRDDEFAHGAFVAVCELGVSSVGD